MKKIKYYTSLWNYIYHDEPQSLEEVVGQVRNEGFGVELWPYFFSLKPYRPTLQTRPISIKRGFNDLFDITYREQLQDLFSGVETSWHSRGTGEKPLKISTFQEHAQQIDTAAAIGSSIISVHDIGYTLTNTQVTNNVTVANQVVEYATTRGITLALETGSFEACLKATNKIPGLKICLDPANIFDTSPHSLEDFISTFSEKICYLHLYDISGDEGHYAPGSGKIPEDDWLFLLRWMRDTEFEGPVVFEIRPLPENEDQSAINTVIDARKYLENLNSNI